MISPLPTLVLLAGGLATRLRPITEVVPKSMIDINGKPFIYHQLHLLKSKGIESVVICVGYLSKQIIDYVGDGKNFGLKIRYSYDGEKLLGTGGSVKKALSLLEEDFFVMYGDSYLNINLNEIWEFYRQQQAIALMTVIKNDNKWDKSNILFKNSKVVAYDKINSCPEMHYIDYGCCLFNNVRFSELSAQKEKFDLSEIHNDLIKQEVLFGYEVFTRFYEVGSHSGILELKQFLNL